MFRHDIAIFMAQKLKCGKESIDNYINYENKKNSFFACLIHG